MRRIVLQNEKVKFGVPKESLLGLFNGGFLRKGSEFPVNVDQKGFRKVFERRYDTIPELTGWRFLDLKRSHALDLKFNRGPLG